MLCQQSVGIDGIGFYAAETFVAPDSNHSIGSHFDGQIRKKTSYMVSAGGTFLGCFITGIAFLLKGQSLLLEWVPMLAVAGVLIYIAAFSVGMGSVPWVIMSEIFPINVKGINCWKLGCSGDLVRGMDSFIHLQLSHELECSWYFNLVCWIFVGDHSVCGKVGARKQRENT